MHKHLLTSSVAIIATGIGTFHAAGAQTPPKKVGIVAPWKPPAPTPQDLPAPGYDLPDSAVIGRVGDRLIRVHDYRERFFDAIEDRPAPDSAGRVEFLNRLADREVMTQCALAMKRPLDFGEGVALREYTNSVLSNALFDRLVSNSVTVTDGEVDEIYRQQYGWAYLVRGIVLDDKAAAEKARRQLLMRRIGWEATARTYSVAPPDSGNGAEARWIGRSAVRGEIAIRTSESSRR